MAREIRKIHGPSARPVYTTLKRADPGQTSGGVLAEHLCTDHDRTGPLAKRLRTILYKDERAGVHGPEFNAP